MKTRAIFAATLSVTALIVAAFVLTLTLMPSTASAVGLGDIPGQHQAAVRFAAVTSTPTAEVAIFRAPFACRVKGLGVVYDTAVTGADTDNFAIDVRNKGAAGSGTTSLVTVITFASGTDSAAMDETTWTLSTTDATITLAAGDVLALRRTTNGSGLDMPAGLVVVRYEPK